MPLTDVWILRLLRGRLDPDRLVRHSPNNAAHGRMDGASELSLRNIRDPLSPSDRLSFFYTGNGRSTDSLPERKYIFWHKRSLPVVIQSHTIILNC